MNIISVDSVPSRASGPSHDMDRHAMNRTTSRHATPRLHAPRRGFSLLEVIIAVTIVALLATLVVPRLTRFLAGANEDKAVAEVNSLANAASTSRRTPRATSTTTSRSKSCSTATTRTSRTRPT